MPPPDPERAPLSRRVIGIDVGGTFTDAVALGPDGGTLLKVPTERDDPAAAVLAAVEALDPGGGAQVVHGSTVATNALLERRGARTAFVTTAGFGDMLVLGRGARAERGICTRCRRDPLARLVAGRRRRRNQRAGGRRRADRHAAAGRGGGAGRPRRARAGRQGGRGLLPVRPPHARAHENAPVQAALAAPRRQFVSLSSEVLPEFRSTGAHGSRSSTPIRHLARGPPATSTACGGSGRPAGISR
ncbi:MAG: hydantoinase/oxoprolinase N-terminal domain-containing protein [Anaerolineae bacterium]